MNEMKSLTLNGKTYNSFHEQDAVKTINGEAPDENGNVEVKIPDGINVTGAEVGQTIVVKEVDENGKPTEWECAELPSGWEVINEIILTEPTNKLVLNVDKDGNPFALEEYKVIVSKINNLSVVNSWYFYRNEPGALAETSRNVTLATKSTVVMTGDKYGGARYDVYQYGTDGKGFYFSLNPRDSDGNYVPVLMDYFGFRNFTDGAVMPEGTHILIIGRRAKV